ncbi:hypothetical protein EN41_12380 [Agrobacterium tumefaciens]|nr:hypothetical protein EN41_12380 [Agrobacterium tumefaciens]
MQNLAPDVILLARHIAYESAAYPGDMTETFQSFETAFCARPVIVISAIGVAVPPKPRNNVPIGIGCCESGFLLHNS